MVEITSGTSLGMKPIVTIEEGTKVWHLVSIPHIKYSKSKLMHTEENIQKCSFKGIGNAIIELVVYFLFSGETR